MRSDVTFQGLTFPTHQIKSLQTAQTASLDLRKLEVDTVELTVKTGTEVYNLVTSDGYPLFTSDGYRLQVSESYALEDWSQANPITLLRGGSQYALWYPRQLKQLAGDFYAISGTSPLGKLTQMEHRGGIYAGREAGSLIREICGDVAVYVSPVFEHVPLYGFLPYVSPSGLTSAVKGSAKDNLLKVLFALNASLRVAADGTLRIENLSTEVSSVIDSGRVYRENAGVVEETPVTSVTVLEHQYIEGTDTKKLFEGTTTAGQIVVFREPCSDLTAEGFTILDSGANWAELSAGTGTLTGAPYVHITREVTRSVSESDTENVVRIEDATLVGITNSGDVADRMADYYAHRKRITCDATVEFERPGDVVSIWDSVAKVMRQACIEKMSPLDLSGTMKAKLSALVGFTPWQTVPFRDVVEVITENETWIAPAGLLPDTNVTVICIGGGDGGRDGADGEDGGSNHNYKTFSRGETGFVETAPAAGGAGGLGGLAGKGGKIVRSVVTVDALDEVNVTIGAGGSENGGVGGDTTFGSISSADGTPSDTGWTNPITGDVYATPGENGIDGAQGGNGGALSGGNGNAGGNVGEHTGGAGGLGFISNLANDSVTIGGGAGSGANAVSDGVAGGDAEFTTDPGGTTGYLQNTAANGVSGGVREARTHYGDGGHGGHGGSGGGGAGGAKYTLKNALSVAVAAVLTGTGGTKGPGGKSSAGVHGCVILIYRVPVTE